MNATKPHDVKPALSALAGAMVTRVNLTAARLVLDFGPLVRRWTARGRPVRTGTVRLHVSCPWRLVTAEGRETGSVVLTRPDAADPQEDVAAVEALVGLWGELSSDDIVVDDVEVEESGALSLSIGAGRVIRVEPDVARTDDENWRLVLPDGAQVVHGRDGWALRSGASSV